MPENNIQIIVQDECDGAPKWLDKIFFEDILRQHKNDKSLIVKSLDVQPALGKGENYASVIYRAQTVVNSKKKKYDYARSYIIKLLMNNEMAKEKLGMGEYDVHNTEMEIYQNILPQFRRMLHEINDNTAIFPNAITVDRANEVLIFNDLREQGYIMPDRIKGLDAQHTKMTLESMAKMHALSIVLNEQQNGIYNRFVTGMFNRKSDAFHNFFTTQMDALINEISKWPGYEYYVKKLINLRPNFIEKSTKVFDREDGDLHVLVHGDLWVNNTMFKYNENNEPVDVILVSFIFFFSLLIV